MPCVKSDHSAVIIKLNSFPPGIKGRGLWRLNTSFLSEEQYITGILEEKEHWYDEFSNITDPNLKWELIKYKIRQYSIKYGKLKAQRISKEEEELEVKLKTLEVRRDSLDTNSETYNQTEN